MQLTNHTVGNSGSSHRYGHGGVYEDVMGLCCIQISIQLVVVALYVTTHISTLPEEPFFHLYNVALKCKMQVASKDSSGVERVYNWLFCTHHEALLCDCTIHY